MEKKQELLMNIGQTSLERKRIYNLLVSIDREMLRLEKELAKLLEKEETKCDVPLSP